VTRRQAGRSLPFIGMLLSVAGCGSPPPSEAEQARTAQAMAKVAAGQAESDRTLPARNAANARQVVVANQQAE